MRTQKLEYVKWVHHFNFFSRFIPFQVKNDFLYQKQKIKFYKNIPLEFMTEHFFKIRVTAKLHQEWFYSLYSVNLFIIDVNNSNFNVQVVLLWKSLRKKNWIRFISKIKYNWFEINKVLFHILWKQNFLQNSPLFTFSIHSCPFIRST